MANNIAKMRKPPRRTRRQSRVRPVKSRARRARSDVLPRVVIVLGMHRSGTSAFSRVINLLGADLPKNLMPPSPENQAGHWESADLMVIHDEILSSACSNWHDWRAFNADWYTSPAAPTFKRRILDVLRNDYANSPMFVVKDPRICRFWPFWRMVLDEFGAKPGVVIPVRNPLEVMASLKRRDGFIHAKSCLLWLRHVIDAEKATRDLPRAVVTYDALLTDWQSVVAKLGAGLGMSWPRRGAMAELEIERFLDTELRHHVIAPEQLAASSEVVDWVKDAYAALVQMSAAPQHKASILRLDRIRAEFEKASTAFGMAIAEGETELAQREAQNAHLRTESRALQQRVAALSDEQRCRGADAEAAEIEFSATLSAEQQRPAEQKDRLAELEGRQNSAKRIHVALAEEASELRTERDALRQRITVLEDFQSRLQAEAEKTTAELKDELERAATTLWAERQRTAKQSEQLADLEERQKSAEVSYATLGKEASELRTERDALLHRIAMLADDQSRQQAEAEGLAAFASPRRGT